MKPFRAVILLLMAACGAGDGRVAVEWTGADTGKLDVPASARWCPNDSVVEILGLVGDSGVALAIFPRDSVQPGEYAIGAPVADRSRPGARVALRWPGKTMMVGYYGLSGSLSVEPGETLTGTVEGTLRNANDDSEVTMKGEFRGLRIHPASAEGCATVTTAPGETS